jgi:hypothetical protein
VLSYDLISARGGQIPTLPTGTNFWGNIQYTPDVVAVAGFAQTETDFCAERLYARARLYRDVEHDGTWEFMDLDPSESTGACVKDSGEAKTNFWTALNGTDWKVRSEHVAQWDEQKDTWNGQKVDSVP